ncbi:hypothetical protein TNCV_3855501 [Trichonephila clavipes]|nr:hypothetical protein TNCV_3855501 [Trichonephila clavipes]
MTPAAKGRNLNHAIPLVPVHLGQNPFGSLNASLSPSGVCSKERGRRVAVIIFPMVSLSKDVIEGFIFCCQKHCIDRDCFNGPCDDPQCLILNSFQYFCYRSRCCNQGLTTVGQNGQNE